MTIVDVVRGRGITVKTDPCPMCGQQACMTGIPRSSLVLCGNYEKKLVLTLWSLLTAMQLTGQISDETIIELKMPDDFEYHITARHLFRHYDASALTVDMKKFCDPKPHMKPRGIASVYINETRVPTKYRDQNGEILWMGSKVMWAGMEAAVSMYADGRPVVMYDENEDSREPITEYNEMEMKII